MRKKRFLLTGLLASVFLIYLCAKAYTSWRPPVSTDQRSLEVADRGVTIAFGSCNREDEDQTYWNTIARHHPAAWLWLGDNVYADTDDMEEMARAFSRQQRAPEYAAFVRQTPVVYGTWDDHDYGRNDAGQEWPVKDAAKALLLDFLRVPDAADVRNRDGVYQAYRVGDVKVILLDTRYFRDALPPGSRPGDRYGANPTGDILGEAQWAWLRDELTDSDAAAHLIASSIQVLPTDHGYEKWANFPAARTRLLNLLAETRPALPLLLSGDRHLAEFMSDTVDGYRIYEMTSSGLTHAYSGSDEPNDKRLGPLVTERNYGLLHFLPDEAGNLQLLAEIRGLPGGSVRSSLALPAPATNKAALRALVYPNDTMTRQLKPCPESPNCVSTQSTQAKKKRDPLPFTGSPEQALEKLKRTIADMSRTTLIEEDGYYLHYTFQTWPIPYIDDVEFILDPEAQVIHYRSASRVGHSDLGVNSRRMKKIAAAFAGE
ncbi:DUF1499 domain-containing protein [Lewinella sp. IMCC34183]|uniref:DUF1499 domain-containing protein n=1 Tax=Lewinella sp. IMCC34183 TaxID=2248762 RepID=UPI000E27CAF8|nr:DUF1499 domain-containing protein [Lewinella sp. IMCC34183]